MKPIKFKQANVNFAENQEEYGTLPAFKSNDECGIVVCCWKLNFKERIKLLFTGKLWLNLMTFNKPLMPHNLSVHRKEAFYIPGDNDCFWKKILRKIRG